MDRNSVLRIPEFRFLLLASACTTLASRILAVVIGFQVYEITHNLLALGYLGLVEAIPAVGLALFGGHIADRRERRGILLITQAISIACALFIAYYTSRELVPTMAPIYAVIFIAGIARGFADPASSAFEAQVVPRDAMVLGSAWLSSAWQGCSIIGPAIGGYLYGYAGPARTYVVVALLFLASLTCISFIPKKPVPEPPAESESIWQSIAIGVKFVFKSQPLVGSMALDLFAVLFGGAIALLPAFTRDVLHVGPREYGWLVAAPSIGALSMTLWATRRPPSANAGRLLIGCVFGFGICMIVFALSRSLALSLTALALSGAFDGVSVIIRKSIVRLYTPNALRGRVSAVSMIFIGSSNEIGAFESGIAANKLGLTRSVWLGGIVTLVVVTVTAIFAPKLRNLDLREASRDLDDTVAES